jgi:hypothetical protein
LGTINSTVSGAYLQIYFENKLKCRFANPVAAVSSL